MYPHTNRETSPPPQGASLAAYVSCAGEGRNTAKYVPLGVGLGARSRGFRLLVVAVPNCIQKPLGLRHHGKLRAAMLELGAKNTRDRISFRSGKRSSGILLW